VACGANGCGIIIYNCVGGLRMLHFIIFGAPLCPLRLFPYVVVLLVFRLLSAFPIWTISPNGLGDQR
jgi:hypothetical protein